MKLIKKTLLAFMLGTVIILGAGCGNSNNQSAQSAEGNKKKHLQMIMKHIIISLSPFNYL